MPGLNHFVLGLCITGCLLVSSVAWQVKMPSHIVALKGSCLVIPCSFDYYQYLPTNPNRVVWYQYVSHGYPLVYDDHYPNSVISKFRGKTQVFTYGRTCTLQIDPVTWSHHRERLYPWVDPENVGSSTYRFYDTTVTIDVVDKAEKPNLMITGDMKVGQNVTVQCSVYHTCPSYPPTLSLNIPQTNAKLTHSSQTDGTSKTTLTTAMFVDRDQQTVECVVKHKGNTTERTTQTLNAKFLPADVPFRISALSQSCVVIPCSYEMPENSLFTRGIWSKKTGGTVYHNGRSLILEHFRDRTRMVGNFHEGDCSLEIDDIKPFDNGPFCFMAEKESARYRFNNSCAFVLMKASPEKPVMTSILPEAEAGLVMTVSCSVTHTCPTHPPEFVWSVENQMNQVTHTETKRGVWETTSNISFIVPEGDGLRNVTCTANFWRDKQESSTSSLNVKGSLTYRMRRSAPVVAPVLSFALIVILAAGIFVCKKRRKTKDSLRPPPRPEKRNNITAPSCNAPVSKPRFPSPKNDRRAIRTLEEIR